ncbi:hypothetical protein PVK06_036476 [Gossypium arboreum]|uniref:Uncharacterized protein n=1 Tax=Gossypium arboreum TaxID=29729 RepID=A0ABR0NJM3_GOSAR|nr:hypothetical protein PVK06_036476 [Gossypium arboreum]
MNLYQGSSLHSLLYYFSSVEEFVGLIGCDRVGLDVKGSTFFLSYLGGSIAFQQNLVGWERLRIFQPPLFLPKDSFLATVLFSVFYSAFADGSVGRITGKRCPSSGPL